MPRKAPVITIEEFKEKFYTSVAKIEDKGTYEYSSFTPTPTIDKDLSKIEFDWENQADCYWKCRLANRQDQNSSGWEVLDNRLLVYWMWAGGDWESPVSFIIYWDGKKFRAYIPEEGNTFNKQKRSAWGNNDEDEEKAPEADFELMKKDIIKRIQIS